MSEELNVIAKVAAGCQYVAISAPNTLLNDSDKWLVAEISGGTPTRGWGTSLVEAIDDLEQAIRRELW